MAQSVRWSDKALEDFTLLIKNIEIIPLNTAKTSSAFSTPQNSAIAPAPKLPMGAIPTKTIE
ncbi:MAG: hypothetical protein HOE44_02695, partial [Candidatus Marinimicrobia bacterium]|nr:hypothetical protein [Candidatus Neomarinimicrobiota bacterium]